MAVEDKSYENQVLRFLIRSLFDATSLRSFILDNYNDEVFSNFNANTGLDTMIASLVEYCHRLDPRRDDLKKKIKNMYLGEYEVALQEAQKKAGINAGKISQIDDVKGALQTTYSGAAARVGTTESPNEQPIKDWSKPATGQSLEDFSTENQRPSTPRIVYYKELDMASRRAIRNLQQLNTLVALVEGIDDLMTYHIPEIERFTKRKNIPVNEVEPEYKDLIRDLTAVQPRLARSTGLPQAKPAKKSLTRDEEKEKDVMENFEHIKEHVGYINQAVIDMLTEINRIKELCALASPDMIFDDVDGIEQPLRQLRIYIQQLYKDDRLHFARKPAFETISQIVSMFQDDLDAIKKTIPKMVSRLTKPSSKVTH